MESGAKVIVKFDKIKEKKGFLCKNVLQTAYGVKFVQSKANFAGY